MSRVIERTHAVSWYIEKRLIFQLTQTKVDLMRVLLLLPAVLLVFLVRCESVGNNSVLVGLLSASDHDSTGVLSNGSSGEAGCRLQFTEDDNECSFIHQLCPNVTCQFVEESDSCGSEGGLIPYFHFLYCVTPSNLIPLAMFVLFVWLVVLFVFLGATADDYFCPSLVVMSQLLRLNQNLAGVTLLALGNGAPDMFSAYAAITQAENGKAGLAIGALFGAGMFVTTIVTGAVSIYKPFTLTKRPFMRDVIFYIFAVFLTFYVLWTNTVELYQAIVFVLMYILYVMVVFVGRVLYQKVIKKKLLGRGDIPRHQPIPEGEEMHREARGRSSSSDENAELNTEQRPLVTANRSSAPPQVDNSKGVARPSPDDTTPLLNSASPRRDYHSVPPRGTINGLERSLQHAPPRVLEEEEEDQLTATLPASLGHSSSQVETRPAQREQRVSPLTDTGDDDETFQAKLLAVRKEARHRRRLRKTISGALDITEDVTVALLGNPNLAEACHHSPAASRTDTPTPSDSPPPTQAALPNLGRLFGALQQHRTATRRPHPFMKMIKGVWPFDEDFKRLRWYSKVVEILKLPVTIILALTVPVVDYDEEDHKWNKWLNCLHCLLAPLTMVLLIKVKAGHVGLLLIGNVLPVWTLIVVGGSLTATFVALTSKNEKPPRYHGPVFSFLGFVSAIVWIYVVANEIVALLQAFGIVLSLSDAVLGLTLLAWGNSIGDAISNFTMAKQGFPRMAISACFGGPLLNMLIGIGIASIVKSAQSSTQSFKINFSGVELVSAAFLLFSLCFQLVAVLVQNFRLRRTYGAIVIAMYLVFVAFSILTEYHVIPVSIPGVTSY